jgi:hypothetical protein
LQGLVVIFVGDRVKSGTSLRSTASNEGGKRQGVDKDYGTRNEAKLSIASNNRHWMWMGVPKLGGFLGAMADQGATARFFLVGYYPSGP